MPSIGAGDWPNTRLSAIAIRAGGVTRLRQMAIRANVEILQAAFDPFLHDTEVRLARVICSS